MRTVVIPSGPVILGLSALAGWRLGGGAQSIVIATKIFIPIWLVVAVINHHGGTL